MNMRRGSIINKSMDIFSARRPQRNINYRLNKQENTFIRSCIKRILIKLSITIILLIFILTIKKINSKPSNYIINFIDYKINEEIDLYQLYKDTVNMGNIIKQKGEKALEVINLNVEGSQEFIQPMDGDIVGHFQPRKNMEEELQGNGIVLEADLGKNIIASEKGVVLDIGNHKTNKYYIIIKHRGELLSVYKNLGNVFVEKNQRIDRGQIIGSNADKLEFEIWHKKEMVDPLLYINTNIEDI